MLELTNLNTSNTNFEESEHLSFNAQQDIKGGSTGIPGAGWVGGGIFGAVGGYVGWKLAESYGVGGGGRVPAAFIGSRIGTIAGTVIGASLSE